MGSVGKRCVVGLGLLFLFLFAATYAHQWPFDCPTALSRLDLLHALTTGTVAIDAYDNTPDRAEFAGHYYSDKAPGAVVVALPGFVIGAVFLKIIGIVLESDAGWLYSSWIACFASVGIVAATGAFFLFKWLLQYVSPQASFITTLAIFLGASPLVYATMLFSHSLVAGCLAIGLWAVNPPLDRPADRFRSKGWLGHHWRDLLAGFLCGWALASEYTSGIVVTGLLLWQLSNGKSRAICFSLAALPPLLLIPFYSWMCFHNPFILPYSLHVSFPQMKEGIFAIGWPILEITFNLLFSPARGLFFWTPFLIMAIAGYWRLLRINRRLFWLVYAVPILQVVIISGRVWDWQAGPTLGARYLTPILPFLALPCALGVQCLPRIGTALALYSVGITTLAILTNASPASSTKDPLLDLHIPLLLQGEFSPNLGRVVGLPPYASIAFYYLVMSGGIYWIWRRVNALPFPPALREEEYHSTLISHET